MSKEVFLNELESRLAGLNQDDIDERLSFYSEMIDDRMEDGLGEEEAVEAIGSVDTVFKQIMSEIPMSKLVKEKVRPKEKLETWKIILLVLTFPVWFSLITAVAATVFSLYVAVWSVLISFYAVDLSLAVSAFASVFMIPVYVRAGNMAGCLFAVGAVIVCAGLAILLFFACIWMTKALIKLTKAMILNIKYLFVGKEAAN